MNAYKNRKIEVKSKNWHRTGIVSGLAFVGSAIAVLLGSTMGVDPSQTLTSAPPVGMIPTESVYMVQDTFKTAWAHDISMLMPQILMLLSAISGLLSIYKGYKVVPK